MSRILNGICKKFVGDDGDAHGDGFSRDRSFRMEYAW
jgi:hypothetical protein